MFRASALVGTLEEIRTEVLAYKNALSNTLSRWLVVSQRIQDLLDETNSTPTPISHHQAVDLAQRQVEKATSLHAQRKRQAQNATSRLEHCRDIARRLGMVHDEAAALSSGAQNSSDIRDLTAAADQQEAVVRQRQQKVKMTEDQLKSAMAHRGNLERAKQGTRAHGFAAYLSRAPEAERIILNRVIDEAQEEGARRRGRKGPPTSDERQAQKQRRAAKAKARRAEMKLMPPTEESKAKQDRRRKKHRDDRRHSRQQEQVTRDDVAPVERRHDERLKRLPPEQQARYQLRLDRSREKGRKAISRDLDAVHALGETKLYQPLHGAVRHTQQARLIAVRGDNWTDALSGLEKGNLVLEDWLADPARRRNTMKGVRSRLNFAAGHFLIALPEKIHNAMQSEASEAALACMVDRLIARMGLEGHRVAAYLHLDSKSGHPHLHITYARVRATDLSVWSMEGRMRTPAMWLHGRTETALAFGEDMIAEDIDALGGSGDAALAGEALMAAGNLFATRTDLHGKVIKIAVQGPEAAQRMHQVGRSPFPLPGGMGKFGCGTDPKEEKIWAEALKKAKADGDENWVKHLLKHKPQNRGWWLPLSSKGGSQTPWKFGKYLKRGSAYHHASYRGKPSI